MTTLAVMRGRGERQQDVADLALLVVVMIANPTQVFVVPEEWQFVSQPLFALLAVLIVVRSGSSLVEVGFDPHAVRSGLRWGGLAVAVVLAVFALVCAVPAGREALDDPAIGAYTAGHVLVETLLRIPIVTAGPEEVLFRGAVLAAAVRRWGWRVGAIASAVVFGFWHVAPTLNDSSFASLWVGAGAVLGAVAVTFAGGLIFAWLRHRSGSLVAPFLAHWATNAVALAAVYFVSR